MCGGRAQDLGGEVGRGHPGGGPRTLVMWVHCRNQEIDVGIINLGIDLTVIFTAYGVVMIYV